MRMPPTPEPNQTSAPARAGIERWPLTSAAMSLSPTTAIQGAPNATDMTRSAALATTHDFRVSTDGRCDVCSIFLALQARPAGLWVELPV